MENDQKDIRVVAISLRCREDIDTAFNAEKNGKYNASGIEVKVEDSFVGSGSKIFLLAKNGGNTAAVEVKQQ